MTPPTRENPGNGREVTREEFDDAVEVLTDLHGLKPLRVGQHYADVITRYAAGLEARVGEITTWGLPGPDLWKGHAENCRSRNPGKKCNCRPPTEDAP